MVSGETWAVLNPPGWLRYKRALYYPVIYPYIRNVRIMIGHLTFCGALHDFPTMTPRTLDWCCFFFFFSLARMITRSQSFVAEHPQHGLSRCQSPVFKVIHLWNKYVFFYLEGFFFWTSFQGWIFWTILLLEVQTSFGINVEKDSMKLQENTFKPWKSKDDPLVILLWLPKYTTFRCW